MKTKAVAYASGIALSGVAIAIHFGGCEAKASGNCIRIVPDWNHTVRLYRPRQEILDGIWKFREAQPVS